METTKDNKSDRAPDALAEAGRPVDLARHQRFCKICRHTDRRWIEDDFLHWHSPLQIAKQYDIADPASIYRHAHALGLFALRKRNLRYALELIIEQAEDIPITSGTLVRAIRAYACLTDDGQWVEPPRRLLVSRQAALEESQLNSESPS